MAGSSTPLGSSPRGIPDTDPTYQSLVSKGAVGLYSVHVSLGSPYVLTTSEADVGMQVKLLYGGDYLFFGVFDIESIGADGIAIIRCSVGGVNLGGEALRNVGRGTTPQTWHKSGVAPGTIVKIRGLRQGAVGTWAVNAGHSVLSALRIGP